MKINTTINASTINELIIHLEKCSGLFVPPLNTYVDIKEYVDKIFNKAVRFEAYNNNNDLVGLIALYIDPSNKTSFITNVSVDPQYQKMGIAKILLKNCKKFVSDEKYLSITLEVFDNNINAVEFYKKNKFKIIQSSKSKLIMQDTIKRDFNNELKDTLDHKYVYNFDFEIIHPYMIESFKPYFIKGSCLELGSFKGDFTKLLLPFFDDITCVEAADGAISVAKSLNGDRVNYVHGMFEDVTFKKKYDNIVLTHVLEHITDPVAVLKRINDQWLSDTGRFFLVCPNANAPSRQIAVKMGIISHNSEVTPAEKEHGHQITYTLDTLERDAKLAGLKVVHRSGIFFKALANFQWDQLLNTDIISKEYLDGCYKLGQQYPDLCSSIFLLCEKGK